MAEALKRGTGIGRAATAGPGRAAARAHGLGRRRSFWESPGVCTGCARWHTQLRKVRWRRMFNSDPASGVDSIFWTACRNEASRGVVSTRGVGATTVS